MEKDYTLRDINDLKTTTLWLTQKKWYKMDLELTDDAFVYGQIYHKGWKQTTVFKTTTGEMKVCNSFSSKYTLKTMDDVELGSTTQKLFNRRVTLTLNDGFQATYYNPSIWRSEYIWEDPTGVEIMRFKFKAFSCKKAEITLSKPAAQIPHFKEMLLMAVKFYTAQMAAAAAM